MFVGRFLIPITASVAFTMDWSTCGLRRLAFGCKSDFHQQKLQGRKLIGSGSQVTACNGASASLNTRNST